MTEKKSIEEMKEQNLYTQFKPIKEARTKWGLGNIVTIDIETYDWTNPVALGMYEGAKGEYHDFVGEDCIEQFCEEIFRRKWRSKRFVAHNGGNFDFIPIIQTLAGMIDEKNEGLENKKWDLEILTKGSGDAFYIKLMQKEKKTATDGEVKWVTANESRHFQDSIALLPRGLKHLSESFVPEAPKMDFDVTRLGPMDEMSDNLVEEMREYLKRDCVVLYQILKRFTELIQGVSNNNCGPQLTIASTAMAVYQTTFMPRDLAITSSYRGAARQNPEECFRESYYGGRTEVFNMRGENLKYYDVNSLYPYVYTEKPVPIGSVHATAKHFPLDDESVGGVVKIRGNVPENACNGIPVLPTRIKPENSDDTKVVFPTGEIEGWYMANEVRYAKSVGALEDIEILDSYASDYGYPFKRYGETLYDIKKNIDKAEEPAKYDTVKFLLNSFYGKFGMQRSQESIVKGELGDPDFEMGRKSINIDLDKEGILAEDSFSRATYILPRIASEITANARIELHKWLMKAKETGNVWYCDTDSIVTDTELPESDGLGGLDLEYEMKEGIFLAPKVYAMLMKDGYRTKAKGMRWPSMSYYHYEKALEDNIPELISSQWEAPAGFKSAMKKSADENWFFTEERTRSLRQFDNKRIHGESEKPINLETEE